MNQQEFDELLDWLAETPNILERSVIGLTDAQLRQRPTPEEFSLVEQICHLRDIETDGYTIRIGRILNEDHPQLPDLDGSQLAVERDYQAQNPTVALADFATARDANIARLRGIPLIELERTGELEGTGAVTIRRLIEMMRGHDTVHRGEVAALLSGFSSISSAKDTGSAASG